MILGGDVGASYTRGVLSAGSFSYSGRVQLDTAPSHSIRLLSE